MESSQLQDKKFFNNEDPFQLRYTKNSVSKVENIANDFEWIDELIQEERTLEEMGVITEENEQYYWKILDRASVDMMSMLRRQIDLYTLHYNNQQAQLVDQKHPIKIFKLAHSVNDFMLYRQSLKLIISRKAVDCITAIFSLQKKSMTTGMNAGLAGDDFFNKEHHTIGQNFQEESSEFMAQLGAFQTIQWFHQGREFHPLMAVKGLFKSFIRKSMN